MGDGMVWVRKSEEEGKKIQLKEIRWVFSGKYSSKSLTSHRSIIVYSSKRLFSVFYVKPNKALRYR